MGVKNYAISVAGNTSISGVSIAENCPVASLNDSQRYILTDVRNEVAAFGASTITAAATPTLGAEGGAQFLDGTTSVTGFATATAGLTREVHFATATPLVHSSTFSLPSSANITTAAGDVATFRSKGGSLGWKCTSYTRQAGTPITITASQIPNDSVTYARMQNVSATARLLGRASSGAGDVEELSVAGGLGFSGTTLTHTGVIQTITDRYTTYASHTTAIPDDNSIPQVTEGTEVISRSFTPLSASSTIRIRVSVFGGGSASNVKAAAAIFKDGAANAIAACSQGAAGTAVTLAYSFEYTEASGSTAARTYSLRVGPDSGTFYSNGLSTGRLYGGVAGITMTIEEYL